MHKRGLPNQDLHWRTSYKGMYAAGSSVDTLHELQHLKETRGLGRRLSHDAMPGSGTKIHVRLHDSTK